MNFKISITITVLLILLSFVSAAAPQTTQFNYYPSPAVPGDIITILIQVENLENSSQSDVKVKIDNIYPFSVEEESEKEIGNMGPYAKALVQFKIYVSPSAENNTYTIPITITSKQEPIGKTTNQSILISGKEPIVKVINISDSRLVPGQEKEIIFELQNIGTSTAYDIIFELEEDRTVVATGAVVEREITPLGSALGYIEKLEPKEKSSAQVKLSVNREASLKNYTLPITVSYRNSSGTRTSETSYIGFKIAGEVNLDFALKENVYLIAGQTETITLEMFNKGAGKAEFTIVNLDVWFGSIDKEKQFIGSLEPNDVDSFKTTITVFDDIETTDTNIKAFVEYQDTDAKIKTIVVDIPIKVYSAADGAVTMGINPFAGIINIIILAIIVFVGWKVYKKFKNKN